MTTPDIGPSDESTQPEEDEWDLGTCPYYARSWGLRDLPWFDAEGVCYQGCWDEPSCVTGVPSDGWPSVHAALLAIEGKR